MAISGGGNNFYFSDGYRIEYIDTWQYSPPIYKYEYDLIEFQHPPLSKTPELKYYNRHGNSISFDSWAMLFDDFSYRQVANDHIEDGDDNSETVSTVWLGMDHSLGQGAPMIFETMVFGGEYGGHIVRYATEQEALEGHERIVTRLAAGEAP